MQDRALAPEEVLMGRLTHRAKSGWTYFITTKAFQSVLLFQKEETARIVMAKLLEYRDKGNYLLHDFVLMPNHLHLILTPAPSVSLEKAMQLIKGGSSHGIHAARGGKMPIWQSGFHESRVISWADYQKKRDYIHFNPVAAKLVDGPESWTFGSASGKYTLDPIPQGLKPYALQSHNVGPKGPTPKTIGSKASPSDALASGAKARFVPALTQGLKPRPPKEGGALGPEAPTAKPIGSKPSHNSAIASEAEASVEPVLTLKHQPPKEKTVFGQEGPSSKAATVKAAKA